MYHKNIFHRVSNLLILKILLLVAATQSPLRPRQLPCLPTPRPDSVLREDNTLQVRIQIYRPTGSHPRGKNSIWRALYMSQDISELRWPLRKHTFPASRGTGREGKRQRSRRLAPSLPFSSSLPPLTVTQIRLADILRPVNVTYCLSRRQKTTCSGWPVSEPGTSRFRNKSVYQSTAKLGSYHDHKLRRWERKIMKIWRQPVSA
jgi:hypothetical protein